MIDHDHKCIFVHIPKNAGQSVEHFFLGLNGLTWNERHRLLLRHNRDASRGPSRLAHLTAHQYVQLGHITQREFDSYYKFAIVRDPWSRAVSMYLYTGMNRIMSFDRYARTELQRRVQSRKRGWFYRPQVDYIRSPSGELLVDYIARLETLGDDFANVLCALALPPAELPHVNRSTDPSPRRRASFKLHIMRLRNWMRNPSGRDFALPRSAPFSEYYNAESALAVAALYREDIETFSYKTPVIGETE